MLIILLAYLYRLFHFILTHNNPTSTGIKKLRLRKDNYLAQSHTDSTFKNTVSRTPSLCLEAVAQWYGENKMLYSTEFSNIIVNTCQNKLLVLFLKEVHPLTSLYLSILRHRSWNINYYVLIPTIFSFPNCLIAFCQLIQFQSLLQKAGSIWVSNSPLLST